MPLYSSSSSFIISLFLLLLLLINSIKVEKLFIYIDNSFLQQIITVRTSGEILVSSVVVPHKKYTSSGDLHFCSSLKTYTAVLGHRFRAQQIPNQGRVEVRFNGHSIRVKLLFFMLGGNAKPVSPLR